PRETLVRRVPADGGSADANSQLPSSARHAKFTSYTQNFSLWGPTLSEGLRYPTGTGATLMGEMVFPDESSAPQMRQLLSDSQTRATTDCSASTPGSSR